MAASPETQSLKGPGLAAALAAAVAYITPGGQPLGAALTTFAVSYGLQAWSMREARKRSLEDRADAKQMIRSAVSPHRIVYGESLVGGTMIYAQVTGTDKDYLHIVLAVAGHEIQSFGDFYFDDQRIPKDTLDVTQTVTSGTFSGLARIERVAGTTSQSAFANLITESGGAWTSAHQGKGVAAIYARLKWDQDKFQGIPQIRALVRGKKVYDPRDGGTRYTMNPALVLRDYLTADYGLACSSAQINDTAVGAAADICDEWVALDAAISISVTADPATDTFATTQAETRIQTGDRLVLGASAAPSGLTAGSTYYVIRRSATAFGIATSYQNAIEGTAATFTTAGTSVTFNAIEQRRYALSGTFTLDMAPKDIIEDILGAMAGSLVWTGGQYRMSAGAYTTPAQAIGVDDLRGGALFRNKYGRHERVDAIRGTYAEPARDWVLTDYSRVTSGTADLERPLDMPMVANAFRAQRLAQIALNRAAARRLSLPCKLGALPLVAAETVEVTLPALGLAADVFRVVSWTLTGEDGGIGVDLDLEEDAEAYYDWDPADGIAPAINAPLTLPSAVTVATPSGLSAASGTAELIAAGDGTIISRIRTSWTGAAEPNITGYELQWKRSGESTYNSAYLPRDGTQFYIGPVEDGADYNLRVRTLAGPGTRRSDWITNTHTVTGKTAAPTAPTSLGVTSLPNALALAWSACPDLDYSTTEVWEASSNNRSGATQVADLKGNALTRSGFSGGAVRYYWVRHLDTSANVSAWYPSSATGGVSGTAGADPGNEITHDFTGFLAGGATGYVTGAGYWLGYASGSYKFHLGDPGGRHIKWDGSNFYVVGAILADELTVSAIGSIALGATAYLTGAGIWLGYSGAAYKLHIGDPSGAYLKWDGSALTIKGSLVTGDVQVDTSGNVRGGQTAYNTGTGFWIGYTGGAYKFSIGDPSGNRLAWDGSALTVVGTINGIGQYAAGTTITLATAATERNSTSTSYVKVKGIVVPKSGTLRCTWNMRTFSGTTGYSRVYVNGVATGTEKSTTSTSNVAQSDDVSVSGGDTVELYYRNSTGAGNGTFVSSFSVNATVPEVSTVLTD